jgi:uncharacterized membrane protein YqiK
VVEIGSLQMISLNYKTINFDFLFSVSQEKKSPYEVNPKPIIAVDKEKEIDKRRKELARQKETREKQAKEEVSIKTIYESKKQRVFCFNSGGHFN